MRIRLLCVCVALCAVQLHADDAELLRRVAGEEEKALDEWTELPDERRVAILRAGLRSNDDKVAYLAARALDADCLDLEEVRLQARILVAHAGWVRDPDAVRPGWAQEGRLPIGAPDLPALWKTACSVEDMPGAREQLTYYHRALLPEHIPAIVELLERAGPEVFLALLDTLRLVADYTDEHRATAARGFLYGLERLRAERAGRPAPRMAEIAGDPLSKSAFLVLARACWLGPDGFNVEGAHSLYPPRGWILRWAREVPLATEDVRFLSDVALLVDETGGESEAVSWAIRGLAVLGARDALLDLGDDARAAAGLARLGEPARLLELLREDDSLLPTWLAFEVMPVEARRRRLGEILLDPGFGDIEPLARYDAEAEYGVRIREEDLAWIGANLLAIDAHPERVASYFAQVYPEGMTAEVARDVARRLRDAPADADGLDGILARIEVVDREALVGLLDHWGARGRKEALPALARLGEARHVPAMIATFADGEFDDPSVLGRVRDPRVEEHLRAQAASGNDEAVPALAVLYALPEPLIWFLMDPTEAQRNLVLERDPVGAVLHALRDGIPDAYLSSIARLGLAKDERAVAFLRDLREKRHLGLYWAGTAGLALGGDEEARRELGGVMREGRTWLLDGILDGDVLTMGGEEEWIDLWVSRINTNCCLSYDAISILLDVFPTIPLVHDKIIDFGRKDRFARAWLGRSAFRGSRILGGLLPVPKGG